MKRVTYPVPQGMKPYRLPDGKVIIFPGEIPAGESDLQDISDFFIPWHETHFPKDLTPEPLEEEAPERRTESEPVQFCLQPPRFHLRRRHRKRRL